MNYLKIQNVRIAKAKDIGEQQTGEEAMAVIYLESYLLIEKTVEKLENENFTIAWTTPTFEKEARGLQAKIAIVFQNKFGQEEIGKEISDLTRLMTYINMGILEL